MREKKLKGSNRSSLLTESPFWGIIALDLGEPIMMNELILGWKWSDRMGIGDAVQKFGWVLCRPAGYTWSHYHT